MSTWLENLKAGDEVIIESRHSKSIAKVDKITPTKRIVINKCQYDPRNGSLMGASQYQHERLVEPSKERLQEVRDYNFKNNVISRINRFDFSKMSVDELRQIYAIMKTHEENLNANGKKE